MIFVTIKKETDSIFAVRFFNVNNLIIIMIIEFLSQPWHWSVSGLSLALVMFLLLYFGGEFGISSTLRTICSVSGAGEKCDFFQFNWRSQLWNIVFVIGAVLGGWLASTFLASPTPVQVGEKTEVHLKELGISLPQDNPEVGGLVPMEVFSLGNLLSPTGFITLIIGGFLIGFGARWAGGCTSGHAISGLSNLQLPSLIAVIGFFIGGLLMTYLLLPLIYNIS